MFNPTHISSSAPTVNDDFDDGFRNGMFWWNSDTERWYILEDDTVGAADWKNVSGGAITSWDDWTPTITWLGNTPTGVTTIGRYIVLGKACYFTLQVAGTNATGADITNMSCTLPPLAPIVRVNNIVTIDTNEYSGGVRSANNIADINSISDPANLSHPYFSPIVASDPFLLFYAGNYETE